MKSRKQILSALVGLAILAVSPAAYAGKPHRGDQFSHGRPAHVFGAPVREGFKSRAPVGNFRPIRTAPVAFGPKPPIRNFAPMPPVVAPSRAPSAWIPSAPPVMHHEPDRDDYGNGYGYGGYPPPAYAPIHHEDDDDYYRTPPPPVNYGYGDNDGDEGGNAYAYPQYSFGQNAGESALSYRARLLAARQSAQFKLARANARHNTVAAKHLHNAIHELNNKLYQVDQRIKAQNNQAIPYAAMPTSYGYAPAAAYAGYPGYNGYGYGASPAMNTIAPMLQSIIP